MSEAKDKKPEAIRTLACHGVELEPFGADQWRADCPFCQKAGKFYANAKTGQWDCKVCGERGNVVNFLTRHARRVADGTPKIALQRLAKLKSLPLRLLRSRDVGFDGQVFTVPIYSESGTVRDIRRFNERDNSVRASAGCKTQLGGARELAKSASGARVWVCEGEWDAVAMDWTLEEAGVEGDVVTWVPGASIFKEEWAKLYAGRDVVLCYDCDDAGQQGRERAARLLKKSVAKLRSIAWPQGLKEGHDIRDHALAAREAGKSAKEILAELEQLATGLSETGAPEESPLKAMVATHGPVHEIEFEELVERLEGCGVRMTDDHRLAMKIMLAVCMSNATQGDPLWVYVVGAPSCGKTLLMRALQASDQCVFRSSVTAHGLVSGFKTVDGTDPSLIAQLKGKTLVCKDFTEVLSQPEMAQDEIFSTLRGAYDGQVEKSFGNGIHRTYADHYFSMVAGVTHAIHGHSRASLGERFLKFQMREQSQAQAEDILDSIIHGVGREAAMEQEMAYWGACFMGRKVDSSQFRPIDPAIADRVKAVVQVVAAMRTEIKRDKFTDELVFRPQSEAGARLASQLVKLGRMLAHIDGHGEIDEATFQVMKRVAIDTAHGFHLDVMDALVRLGGAGTVKEIADAASMAQSSVRRKIDNLLVLKAVHEDGKSAASLSGGRPSTVYRLSQRMELLWKRIDPPAPAAPRKKKRRLA
jgi:hypothetical protein